VTRLGMYPGYQEEIISFPSQFASNRDEIWSVEFQVDFVKGLLLPRVVLFAGYCASVVCCLEVFWNCLWIHLFQRGDFRLKLGEWFTSI
jgi:hypothetical protein